MSYAAILATESLSKIADEKTPNEQLAIWPGMALPDSLPLCDSHRREPVTNYVLGNVKGLRVAEITGLNGERLLAIVADEVNFVSSYPGDLARQLVESGSIKKLSIGYTRQEVENIDAGGSVLFKGQMYHAPIFSALKLTTLAQFIEVSLCVQPADQNCKII